MFVYSFSSRLGILPSMAGVWRYPTNLQCDRIARPREGRTLLYYFDMRAVRTRRIYLAETNILSDPVLGSNKAAPDNTSTLCCTISQYLRYNRPAQAAISSVRPLPTSRGDAVYTHMYRSSRRYTLPDQTVHLRLLSSSASRGKWGTPGQDALNHNRAPVTPPASKAPGVFKGPKTRYKFPGNTRYPVHRTAYIPSTAPGPTPGRNSPWYTSPHLDH